MPTARAGFAPCGLPRAGGQGAGRLLAYSPRPAPCHTAPNPLPNLPARSLATARPPLGVPGLKGRTAAPGQPEDAGPAAATGGRARAPPPRPAPRVARPRPGPRMRGGLSACQ